MRGVAWRGMWICVRSKDAQKQLARTSLRDDSLIVFWRQNHVTFIFIKTMSHDLLVELAFYETEREEDLRYRNSKQDFNCEGETTVRYS